MNKIIGFTVSKNKINHNDIDVFKRGLSLVEFEKNGLYIYLWGIGDLTNCKIGEKYALSFPLSENLLDRNVLISFQNDDIYIENDWLGSIPIYYNSKELVISTLSLKTLKDKIIHPEGLNNYFEFGYSILEQTPFTNVKFMRYFSKLIINQNRIKIEYKRDPILQDRLFNKVEDEEVVLKKIQDYIINIEKKTKEEIILPTSGGYDSRLLNICIKDKSRIRAFTYGISKKQSESFEVVHAKKISEILGTKWEQIQIGDYDKYTNEWFKIYGFSTHLHGMYHIEFYKKILERNNFGKNATFLSGIFGDVWAGNVKIEDIKSESDLINLGYTHGMSLDGNCFNLVNNNKIKENFILRNNKLLNIKKIRPLLLIRLKLSLISYLTQIPEYFGFPVWTPFLNFDIVTSMLNIKEDRKKDRLWQKSFFAKNEIDLESMNLKIDKTNTLDYDSSKNYCFEPIDVELMQKYIKKDYLEKINYKLSHRNFIDDLKKKMLSIRYIGGALRRIRIKDDILESLYSWYIIKSIEIALKRKQM